MVIKDFWVSLRRFVLIVLTVLAVFNIALSLLQSLTQPQVQSRLELYQTNSILQAAEFETDNAKVRQLFDASIGENPYEAARKQYEEAHQAAQTSRRTLQNQLQQLDRKVFPEDGESQKQQLQQAIRDASQSIDEIDLKLGILQIQQGQTPVALKTWQDLSDHARAERPEIASTAEILQQLWSQPAVVSPEAEVQLEQTLEGWFRDRALAQLYQIQKRKESLTQLKVQQQAAAQQALVKLAIIGGLPALGGLLGLGLLIVLLVQFALQRERSLLAIPDRLTWSVPWDGGTIWQVLIVGFFFIGQSILPLFLGLLGLEPAGFSLRQKALLVLSSYIFLAVAGLSILYVSIKPFFPLPEGWFRFKFLSNWLVWGFGGYFVAIPLVIGVSLVNQQLWDGQGGSNPILSLALQAQDLVALAIFFFTASIAAPVFEEIMFRGFLLPSLTRYLPVWAAVGASSLVFAVAHLSLSEVLPLTVLGMVLGFVYARSRNLLSSILLHSLWNSGTLLTLFVLGS
jgi:uncharacterized protein